MCVTLLLWSCGDEGSGKADEQPATHSGGVASADSWSNYASGFFASYCVECHGAGDRSRDSTTLAEVERDLPSIRCGVSSVPIDSCGDWPPPRQFPIGDGVKPTDLERLRLVEWLESIVR
ncbi:MAG: hypothetical protein HRU17_06495 [Polyangiaceae bacterium]|nr:hypothetical protein [Polyangiaceae bacterium]